MGLDLSGNGSSETMYDEEDRKSVMHLHFHGISLYSRINCDCTAWLIFVVNVLLFSIHFDLPHPFGDRPVLLTHRMK